MANSIPRRVVITGLGLVSPLGSTVESVWDGLTSGRTGIDYLKSLPSGTLPLRWGAEVREFTGQVEDFGPLEKDQMRSIRKSVKVMCREIQMGVAAAQRALHHAGLKPGDYDADRTGVVFGSDYILSIRASSWTRLPVASTNTAASTSDSGWTTACPRSRRCGC